VVTDGEQGKVSFLTYVKERLAGFDQVEGETLLPPSWQREIDDFPEYYRATWQVHRGGGADEGDGVHRAGRVQRRRTRCRPTSRTCAPPWRRWRPVEAFLPSTSPSGFGRNEYYASEQDYLAAVAAAMREEYLAIVESGFLLQIDDPWLIEILTDDATATRRAPPPGTRARGRAQPRAARHPGGPDPAAHLLRLNHGPRLNDIRWPTWCRSC